MFLWHAFLDMVTFELQGGTEMSLYAVPDWLQIIEAMGFVAKRAGHVGQKCAWLELWSLLTPPPYLFLWQGSHWTGVATCNRLSG